MGKLDSATRWLSKRVASASRRFSLKSARVLFITEQNQISRSQIYPFYFFRKKLADQFRFIFDEIDINDFQKSSTRVGYAAEVVFLQPWFTIQIQSLKGIIEKVRKESSSAKIVFLDSYAPLDLRLAQFVDDAVDLYVKKHVFRDRGQYGKSTLGDTHLDDYYSRLYGLKREETVWPIPNGFLEKLVVGPSFATADFMLPTFASADAPAVRNREIDLHARLGGGGDVNHWYGLMRKDAIAKAQAINGIRAVVTDKLHSHRSYMKELANSKICFSPFGYGEVCWRDYEAVVCGALLVKPDMSHVETYPDIFRPFESYVPVRWDLSDLEEKVKYYLEHEVERNAIVQHAYSILNRYAKDGEFLQHTGYIMNKLGK